MYEQGTVIGGRYRLIKQVGEGGMASVWQAEHLTLHSPVALKFLQTSHQPTTEMTERFLREARAAASVRHRNVIEITDFGITDANVPYMVMEFLHGRSLADLMEYDSALDPAEGVRIVSLTLRGLAAVHDAGIVHRDLKPENIFLVEDADGSFPKLLDFGVSRRVGLSNDITQEGTLIGTPDYMSPEQARGARDIDRRTDIYSMGVILYEVISGRLPFEAERLGDLIRKIVSEKPPTLAELRPNLPEGLSEMVAKAMAPNRKDRYSDAREMRWALIEAGHEYGLRPTNSVLISLSELPPPSVLSEDGPSTGDLTLPRAPRTPSTGIDRGSAANGWTKPEEDPRAAYAPTLAGEGAGAAAAPRARLPLLVLLALVAVGAAGSWLYVRRVWSPGALIRAVSSAWPRTGSANGPPKMADAPVRAHAQAWMPMAPGLPPGLLDGGISDAGTDVTVMLEGIPKGDQVRVDGIPIDGGVLILPSSRHHTYRIEVREADGKVVWRMAHPADRDGAYLVWPESRAHARRTRARVGPRRVRHHRRRHR